MNAEAVKRFMRRYIEEVWHKRNLDSAAREFWHPKLRNHYAPEFPNGPDGMKKQLWPILAGFSDIQVEIEDMLIDGEMVVVRLSIRATHTGVFNGIQPTGKRVKFREVSWYRLVDDMLHDVWPISDWTMLIDQLQEPVE